MMMEHVAPEHDPTRPFHARSEYQFQCVWFVGVEPAYRIGIPLTHCHNKQELLFVVNNVARVEGFVANRFPSTTFAMPRYSTSALEWDKVAWRLADHEIKLLPRKTQ